jgi:hypothetical protein
MKTGLAKSVLLVSLAFGVFSGCKSKQLCEPLSACGGDLFAGLTPGADGRVSRSWTVVGAGACQDQLQLPPVAVSLARQPPPVANQRPPDNATADWCGNLVIKSTGEVKEFLVYAPPLPLKVAQLRIESDYDGTKTRGVYNYQQTIDQTRDLVFSESCLTAQGLRLSCPVLGRQLGAFLAAEANIYNMRCQDPDDKTQGGCVCKFDLSFIGGQSGRWALQENGNQIQFFENVNNTPAALVDYCFDPNTNALDLTGSNETPLLNQKSLRTLQMVAPSCSDGVQSPEIGEEGVDCGGPCPIACGSCTNKVADANEDGIDCGGPCLGPGVFCDPDPKWTDKKTRPAACANNQQDPWEEGVDCGGPCVKQCTP